MSVSKLSDVGYGGCGR